MFFYVLAGLDKAESRSVSLKLFQIRGTKIKRLQTLIITKRLPTSDWGSNSGSCQSARGCVWLAMIRRQHLSESCREQTRVRPCSRKYLRHRS